MPPRTARSLPTTPAPVDTLPRAVDSRPAVLDRPPLLLTAAEVAEHLRVDVYTVRRWCHRGELTGHRIGKTWRIDPADLQAFLRERRVSR